jgi:hypothetical protein
LHTRLLGDPRYNENGAAGIDDVYSPDGDLQLDTHALKGLAEDAARLVSEMKPFVAWILDAPLMRPIKDDPKKAALRARCQALVAEYDAPLPKGMRGWSKPSDGSVLFDRDSPLSKTRTTSPPRSRKRSSIRQSERCDAGISTSSGSTSNRLHSLAGAAVKLRLLCDEDIGIAAGESEEDLVSLGQMREFVEPEVGKAQP